LVVVERDPLNIQKVALAGGEDQRRLAQTDTYREGTRLEYNYDFQEDGDFLAELRAKFEAALADKGLGTDDVAGQNDARILEVAKAAQIVGGRSEAELVGFVKSFLAG
jgi:hypothetical protein